ncbi:MAG: hypothetical protein LIP00_08820, partial [Parabacteroides sp.]|nr:hypothetical protein [Parabacteroides sp.]
MEKPLVITRLEERYGIRLEAYTPDDLCFHVGNLLSNKSRNVYSVNARNEVTHLAINGASIEQLDYINDLTTLEYLNLSQNKISLINGLDKLTRLRHLN